MPPPTWWPNTAPATPPAIRPTALPSPFCVLTLTAVTRAQSAHVTCALCAGPGPAVWAARCALAVAMALSYSLLASRRHCRRAVEEASSLQFFLSAASRVCACRLSAVYWALGDSVVWASALTARPEKTSPQVIVHTVFFMIDSWDVREMLLRCWATTGQA